MTIYTVQAPDGKTLQIEGPAGASEADVFAQARRLYQPAPQEEEPQEYAGFTGAFKDQAATLGLADEAAAWQQNPTPENREKFLKAAESKYKTANLGEGHNWEAIKELAGGSLGFLAAPVSAATVGSLATPVAGVAAGAATGASQYTIQNLLRQAQEGGDPNLGKAALAAVGQQGLDTAGGYVFAPLVRAMPFVKNLILPAGKATTEAAEGIVEAARKGMLQTLPGGVVKGVAKGVSFEIPQEVAQQALERWQAGLPLGDDKAVSEYKQAAMGAAVLGGLMGGAEGVVSHRGKPKAQDELREMDDETSGTETAHPEQESTRQGAGNGFTEDLSQSTPFSEEKPAPKSQGQEGEITLPTDPHIRDKYTDEQWAEVQKHRRDDGIGASDAATQAGNEGLGTGVPPAGGQAGPSGPAASGPDVVPSGVETSDSAAGQAEHGAGVRSPSLADLLRPEAKMKERIGHAKEVLADLLQSPALTRFTEGREVTKGHIEQLPRILANKAANGELVNIGGVADALRSVMGLGHENLQDQFANAAPEETVKPKINALKVADEHADEVTGLEGQAIQNVGKKAPKVESITPVEKSNLPNKLTNALNSLQSMAFGVDKGKITAEDVAPKIAQALEEVKNLQNQKQAAGVIEESVDPDVEAAKRPKEGEEARQPVHNDIQWLVRDAFTEAKNGNYNEALLHLQGLADIAKKGGWTEESAKTDLQHELREHPSLKERSLPENQQEIIPPRRVEKGPLKGANTDRGRQVKIKRPKRKPTIKNLMSKANAMLQKGEITERDHKFIGDQFKKGESLETLHGTLDALKELKTKREAARKGKEYDPNAPKFMDAYDEHINEPGNEEARKASFETLRNLLDKYGLRDIALRVSDKIKHVSDERNFNVLGSYQDKIISIALNANNPIGVLNHEVIHALKDMGLFTSKEWEILTHRAAQEWMIRHEIDDRAAYHGLPRAVKLEEAIAEAFRAHDSGVKKDGFLAPIIRKIKKFFEAVDNWASGSGFQTAEDIFNKIKSGEIGSRERNTSAQTEQKFMSADPNVQNKAVGELMLETRNFNDGKKLLNAAWDAMKIGTLKKALYTMTMDGITRTFANRLPSIRKVNELVRLKEAMRARLFKHMNEVSEDWRTFFKDHPKGAEVLANLIHRSTLNGVRADKGGVNAAIANDKEIKELVAKKASQGEIDHRVKKIKEVYKLYNDLAGYGAGKGHAIYNTALNEYENTFNAYFDVLKDNVKSMGLDAVEETTALGKIQEMYDNAKKIGVYAPLRRFGKYYFRVGDGKEFHMFESATARNLAMANRAEQLKAEGRDDVLDPGDDPSVLRSQMFGTDKLLNDVFKLVDKASGDTNELKDNIFQLYLASLPGTDLWKSSLHRKGKPGYDPDALRVFVAHHATAANQLSRLAYGDNLRNAVGDIFGSLEVKKNEEPRPDQLKLRTVAEHIKKAVDKELSYSDPGELGLDRYATLGNKFVFYYMLSAPKSALVQMTQLPIVGLPVLSAKYGAARSTAMLAKYSNFMNTLVGRNASGSLGWIQPSVINSKYIQDHKNPAMKAALIYGFNRATANWDLFMNTYAADMTSRAKVSSSQYEGGVNKVFRKTLAMMSGSFHHMERMTREMMYMSSYELELNNRLKPGMNADAKEAAMDAASDAAAENVYKALFNYTTYNKPMLMKMGPAPKLATQFMSFPLQMTSYLVRNGLTMVKKTSDPKERIQAATQLFGTLGMTAMFAGVTGLPGYSMIMGLAEGLRDLLMPPDGDDDPYEDEEGNPLGKRNLDLWFREYFLPTHFGKGSEFAKALGLSDTSANLLQRAIKMGPVSALTDVDVGTSTSMDNMWFHNDIPSDSAKNAFQQMAFDVGLGAFGSMGSQMFSALDEFEQGEFGRGVEKLLPAFFRGGARAARFATEGNLTREGYVMRNAEWYTTGKLAAQTIGFGSTEADELQKKNFMAKQMTSKMEKERTQVLNGVDRAYRSDDEGKIDAAMDAVDAYNDKNPILPITQETLDSSLKGHEKRREDAIEGLDTDPRMQPYLEDIMSRSRNEEASP